MLIHNMTDKQKFLNSIAKWALDKHTAKVQSYFELTDEELETLDEKLETLDDKGKLI